MICQVHHTVLNHRLEVSFIKIPVLLQPGCGRPLAININALLEVNLSLETPIQVLMYPRDRSLDQSFKVCLLSQFKIYIVCRIHNMSLQCYADNTQRYMTITPTWNQRDVSLLLQVYLSDIRSWVCSNFLKINQEKSELIVLAAKHKINYFYEISINFDGIEIKVSPCVKTL